MIVVLCIKGFGHVLKNRSPYFSLDVWPSQFFLGFLGLENVPAFFSPYTSPRSWCHTGRLPWWLGRKCRWIPSPACELFPRLHSAMIHLLIEREGIRNLLLNPGSPGMAKWQTSPHSISIRRECSDEHCCNHSRMAPCLHGTTVRSWNTGEECGLYMMTWRSLRTQGYICLQYNGVLLSVKRNIARNIQQFTLSSVLGTITTLILWWCVKFVV